jgi:hypothetical protein
MDAARENDPSAFVNRSRDISSPTHDLFSWEYGVDAAEIRLAEARRMIRDMHERMPNR